MEIAMTPRSALVLPERIERRIVRVPIGGCWLWTASTTKHGYGHIYFQGKVCRAHRVVFLLAGGHIPDGAAVMHRCDTPACVNPHHLTVGTHQENMADMVAKRRARAPAGAQHWTKKSPQKAIEIARRNLASTHHCGAKNNNAKVNEDVVKLIRADHAADPKLSMSDLGSRYGIGREQTRKIVKGIVWKS